MGTAREPTLHLPPCHPVSLRNVHNMLPNKPSCCLAAAHHSLRMPSLGFSNLVGVSSMDRQHIPAHTDTAPAAGVSGQHNKCNDTPQAPPLTNVSLHHMPPRTRKGRDSQDQGRQDALQPLDLRLQSGNGQGSTVKSRKAARAGQLLCAAAHVDAVCAWVRAMLGFPVDTRTWQSWPQLPTSACTLSSWRCAGRASSGMAA
jgi:hypothetical protein